jgi:hypothetical protein
VRKNAVASLVVLIFVLASARSANAQMLGAFTQTGSMTTARADHSATLLPDGTVLIAGGDGSARYPAGRTAELYDPATGTFSPTGSMIVPRYAHTATLLPNGKVLIVGGGADNIAELYDPATHEFSLTGRPARGWQYWVTATLLRNGKVLIAGREDAELYDPATESFTPAGAYATTSRQTTATLLADGRVLLVGEDPGQIYDAATNSFSVAGSLAPAGLLYVEQHTATLLNNGKVLIAGGTNDGAGAAGRLDAAETYDPATSRFTAARVMTAPRDVHAAVLLSDGRVLIAGGDTGVIEGRMTYYGGSLATAELYDPATGKFAATGSMSAGRSAPAATILKSGDVLITGGVSMCGIGCSHGTLASAEIYHLSARRRVVKTQ